MGSMDPNAARIARNHKIGCVGALLNHEPPPLTRNHARENALRLKEMQRKRRDEKIEQEARAAEAARPFKMKQFEGVMPRFFEERASPAGGPGDEGSPQKRGDFLRKAEGKLAQPKLPEEARQPRPSRLGSDEAKPAVPRAVDAAPRPVEVEKNFLRANRDAAIAGGGYASNVGGACRAPGKENRTVRWQKTEDEIVAERLKKIHGSATLRRDPSNVPAYITDRKEEMAEDQRRREQEAQALREKVPDGYRLIPEDERMATLEALNMKKKTLEAAFSKLPMKIESEGQKRRQKEILDQLKEVEDALRVFSKAKVFVQL